jgi:bifunctional DNA-binding transcriptional regulator/antitoxin component of YhaV-PrlF toxin-antitoxin module
MTTSTMIESALDGNAVGFAVVDEKCRISVPREVRQTLDIGPGSRLAYATIDGMFVLISQDKHLALLVRQATKALANAGLTAQDIIEELPAVREEMMREAYGEEVVAELARLHAALRAEEGEQDAAGSPPADE